MSLRGLQDWERQWLINFVDTDTFTVGYIWGFTLVAICPLLLACGLSFLTVGEIGACTLIGGIGVVGTGLALQRVRRVVGDARRSYREARPEQVGPPARG